MTWTFAKGSPFSSDSQSTHVGVVATQEGIWTEQTPAEDWQRGWFLFEVLCAIIMQAFYGTFPWNQDRQYRELMFAQQIHVRVYGSILAIHLTLPLTYCW